jgi:hypothetical protein
MTQFQKFEAGMPMSIPPKVDSLPIATNTVITKGDIICRNAGGFMTVATVALAVKKKCFVAIETVSNNPGADGAKAILCVGQGQRATVLTKSILSPTQGIKVSATNGAAALFDEVLDNDNIRIGHYVGKEGGVYSKDATPFGESFTTDSHPEVACAVDDIIVVELE